ncbi:FtsW/RodA/SpoVE family cell cycle protein [Schinkia azotoformans]|uniref:FtsW/RodA/SpoVE family cell cycle protein n=1 Tax=Schinkia azotoformans TaxID=1454 RepID=UPI00398B94AF
MHSAFFVCLSTARHWDGFAIFYCHRKHAVLIWINKKILAAFFITFLLFLGLLVYLYFLQPDVIYSQLIPLLKPHQQERIIGWLNPTGNYNQAYQAKKSLLAVGSGGWRVLRSSTIDSLKNTIL